MAEGTSSGSARAAAVAAAVVSAVDTPVRRWQEDGSEMEVKIANSS